MTVDSTKVKELAEQAAVTDDRDTLREIATQLGITFSGNTGADTLKAKIATMAEEQDEPLNMDDPVIQAMMAHQAEKKAAPKKKSGIEDYSPAELESMNPRDPDHPQWLKRAIVRAKGMKLVRVKVNNLDPNDSQVPGAIITVFNKYLGKVSKYIPFGEENEQGYHIPMVLYNELKARKYVMRKEVPNPNGSFGVKKYKSQYQNKFAIEILPPLTAQELKTLADDQKARGAIDHSV